MQGTAEESPGTNHDELMSLESFSVRLKKPNSASFQGKRSVMREENMTEEKS